MTRIQRFTLCSAFSMVGLAVLTNAILIAADTRDHYLLAGIAETFGMTLTGRVCNIAIGARILFWLLLAVELVIVARAVSFKLTASERAELQKVSTAPAETSRDRLLIALLFPIFVAGFYFISYSIGHHAGGRFKLCSTAPGTQLAYHWYLLVASSGRAAMIALACLLYFRRKASAVS
ncbi:hypothetical protein [uncultured Reyranella sp.]|uniref:hypothetical protein n=1 Tax=uncultured Reyranella sp. TaxID=735512 RepID=UPI00259D289A|nr:hypothetical protein [uncultured Reyranella sp.]